MKMTITVGVHTTLYKDMTWDDNFSHNNGAAILYCKHWVNTRRFSILAGVVVGAGGRVPSSASSVPIPEEGVGKRAFLCGVCMLHVVHVFYVQCILI